MKFVFFLYLFLTKHICSSEDKCNYGLIRHVFPKLDTLMKKHVFHKNICLYAFVRIFQLLLSVAFVVMLYKDEDSEKHYDCKEILSVVLLIKELLQTIYFIIQNTVLNVINKKKILHNIFQKNFINKKMHYIFVTLQVINILRIIKYYGTEMSAIVLLLLTY